MHRNRTDIPLRESDRLYKEAAELRRSCGMYKQAGFRMPKALSSFMTKDPRTAFTLLNPGGNLNLVANKIPQVPTSWMQWADPRDWTENIGNALDASELGKNTVKAARAMGRIWKNEGALKALGAGVKHLPKMLGAGNEEASSLYAAASKYMPETMQAATKWMPRFASGAAEVAGKVAVPLAVADMALDGAGQFFKDPKTGKWTMSPTHFAGNADANAAAAMDIYNQGGPWAGTKLALKGFANPVSSIMSAGKVTSDTFGEWANHSRQNNRWAELTGEAGGSNASDAITDREVRYAMDQRNRERAAQGKAPLRQRYPKPPQQNTAQNTAQNTVQNTVQNTAQNKALKAAPKLSVPGSNNPSVQKSAPKLSSTGNGGSGGSSYAKPVTNMSGGGSRKPDLHSYLNSKKTGVKNNV